MKAVKAKIASFLAAAFCAAVATPAAAARAVETDLPYHPADGIRDVARANGFGAGGKWKEGLGFVAQLRAESPRKNLEERQSVDMAEYALLRHDLAKNRKRCIECLENVRRSGEATFWGWAAWTFLKELGVDAPMPRKDPLRGLGSFGDGVVNLVPAMLTPVAGKPVKGDAAKLYAAAAAEADAADGSEDALAPGSAVRRAVLRTRLVDECGEEAIDEVLSMEDGGKLFSMIWDDDAVLEDFLLSGPVFNASAALKTLMTLFLNDRREGWSKTPVGRKATVAVAINAMRGDDIADTVRHWAAYRRIGMFDRFLPSAAKRDCREWRFIVRRPVDPADTLYLNTVKKFPTKYMRNVGLNAVPYRKRNCFGTSKWAKNDAFLAPWKASGWPRQYLRTRVGGVCTEQAMWAAMCANAHGLMAERAGQPGHCCWLSRAEDGAWQIVSGIRPYTQGVFTLWGRGFQYIQSTERAFADRAKHDISELRRFLADRAEKVGDTVKAARLWRSAAFGCPYNVPALDAYTAWMKRTAKSVEDWCRYVSEVASAAPEGRLATWDFVHEALDRMKSLKAEAGVLADTTIKAFKALPQPESKIAEEMNFAKDALKRALARFKGDERSQMKIITAAMEANRFSKTYLSQIYACAMKNYADDPKMLKRFFATAAECTGSGMAGAIEDKGFWRQIYAMRGVMEDRALFRRLASIRNEYDPPRGSAVPPYRDFGRPLVSGDALVTVSSKGAGDAPEDRPRISDATAYDQSRRGIFATKKEKTPWVEVGFAGDAVVHGVSAVGDCRGLAVWTAGEDGAWREVANVVADEKGLRADMTASPVPARKVRVGLKNGEGTLSLNKVLVYGDRLY